jgi:transposase
MAKRKPSTLERLRSGRKLNRKQRKEVQQRLNASDPGLEIVNRDAAGIDVGNQSHYVAVPPGRDAQPVREFGSWTAALEEMARWLKSCGIRTVVLQSTGVYWIAVYDILQSHGLQVNLVDARGTKNVPGRKSDVQECQWLLKLHTYGLLRSCFLPSPKIHGVRTMWRLRDQHVKDAGREIQHMPKALIEMNVHLHNAISDLSGVSGQAMIRAIVSGQRDLRALTALRDPRIQASEQEIIHSLQGNWKDQRIDGIDVMTIQTVVAEVGTDLRAWKTEAHWTSWLNLAPKRDISGGRVIRHTREHHTNRVGNAFRIAAQSLVRSVSYLGARYRYLRAKLGGLKAVKAMARVLACLFYRLLTKGQLWIDQGAEQFERRRQQRDLASLQRRARNLGMQLVPAA